MRRRPQFSIDKQKIIPIIWMHPNLMYICFTTAHKLFNYAFDLYAKLRYMQLDRIINTAYSFGAAIVVFGAWAKLGHKEYSETALTIGLLTETGIFCIYGLMEWRKRPAAGPAEQALQTPPPNEQPAKAGTDTGELTDTLRQTNRILNKVFRAE
jgi:hypothetical protein